VEPQDNQVRYLKVIVMEEMTAVVDRATIEVIARV
jgi:hypothetical protein